MLCLSQPPVLGNLESWGILETLSVETCWDAKLNRCSGNDGAKDFSWQYHMTAAPTSEKPIPCCLLTNT